MIDKGKRNILGVNVSVIDYEGVLARILDAGKNPAAVGGDRHRGHGMMEAATNDEHRYRLNQLELVVPDGQPIRWALNLFLFTMPTSATEFTVPI